MIDRETIKRIIVENAEFAEAVSLIENPDEHYVIAVRLVALRTTTNYGHYLRFVDFMRSRQGRDVLQRFGFVD